MLSMALLGLAMMPCTHVLSEKHTAAARVATRNNSSLGNFIAGGTPAAKALTHHVPRSGRV